MATNLLIEEDIGEEDRTGGLTQPGSGFERVREELASQRTVSGTVGYSLAVIKGAPKALRADDLAQALLRTIDFLLLPNDTRRFALYDSIALAILQRIQASAEYISPQAVSDVIYEGSEPLERVRAAHRLFRSMAAAKTESSTAYMNETDAV